MISFDDIFEQYQDKVFSKVLLTLGSKSDAEEITQYIFVKIYFALPNFRGDSKMNTWIYAIVRNTCIDFIRKNKPEISQLEDLDINFFSDGDDLLNQIESADIIEHVFSFLRVQQRHILILKYHEGFLISEIAKLLECGESSTKKILYQARRDFIFYYKKYYENQTT